MKLLDRLEKSKAFWYLLGISIVFFFLRLPSLIEPYWYGDEGIYQVIGMALREGQLLYTDIWDNKPPLLYVVYAIFAGDQFWVRFASLIVGIGSVVIFFFLIQRVFKRLRISIITTSIFALLFGTPLLEGNIANAENFILFPIMLAAIIIYRGTTKKDQLSQFVFAGFLLGIAFLFKIVAIFDLIAFSTFLLMSTSRTNTYTIFRQIRSLIVGFTIPFLITVLVFVVKGGFSEFITSVFVRNVEYVEYGNALIIPQGLLILKLIFLFSGIWIIWIERKKLTKPALFVFLWTLFSLFNAFFSQRPYTHYVLVLLPSICLYLGLLFSTDRKKRFVLFSSIFIGIVTLVFVSFELFTRSTTLTYYENALLFVTGRKEVTAYQAFFDPETPRDYQLVSFIKNHTSPEESLFIWGNSPQIYALSGKLPPGKYTVAYHITQFPDGIANITDALNMTKPTYIITLDEVPLIPLPLQGYQMKYAIPGAIIYERTY